MTIKSLRIDKIKEIIQNHPKILWNIVELRAWLASFFGKPMSIESAGSQSYPFLFIVGSGRSGNTLIRRCLMEDYDIYIPPETYVLPKVANARVRARGLRWESFVELSMAFFEYHPEFDTIDAESLRCFVIEAKTWSRKKQSVKELLLSYYAWLADKTFGGAAWLGDKTPFNTMNLGPISKIIPGAFYLYLLRDGVDVAVSYVEAGIYSDLKKAAQRWVQSHLRWSSFKKQLEECRYMEVRYEDFVADPSNVLKGITENFQIPRRTKSIEISGQLGDVEKRSQHSNVLNPPSTSSIGKGRKSIDKRQREIIRPVINKTLLKCGYKKI